MRLSQTMCKGIYTNYANFATYNLSKSNTLGRTCMVVLQVELLRMGLKDKLILVHLLKEMMQEGLDKLAMVFSK